MSIIMQYGSIAQELEEKDFMQRLLQVWERTKWPAIISEAGYEWKKIRHDLGCGNVYTPSDGRIHAMLMKTGYVPAEDLRNLRKPDITVEELQEDWLLVECKFLPDDTQMPVERQYFFATYFATHHTGQGSHAYWRYVPMPENCTFNANAKPRSITFHFEGRDLVFEQGDVGWPDVLQDPKPFITAGLIQHLLTPKIANPLSVLLAAKDRMVSGYARQICDELELAMEHAR